MVSNAKNSKNKNNNSNKMPLIIGGIMMVIAIAILVFTLIKNNGGVSTTGGTVIKSSPDKYTHYVKDYAGLNVATACNYWSYNEDKCYDKYGYGSVQLIIVANDNAQVTKSNAADYHVVSQDVAPNTEIKLTFEKDSKGEEYSSLIDTQSLDRITLKVQKN